MQLCDHSDCDVILKCSYLTDLEVSILFNSMPTSPASHMAFVAAVNVYKELHLTIPVRLASQKGTI